MSVALEITVGPLAGKRVAVPEGQKVLVGRSPQRTDFALPHDTLMSSLHFVLECGPGGCQIWDCNSTNGTFLNGVKIKQEKLKAGDEVRAGQSTFVVRVGDEATSASTPKAASAPQAVQPETRTTVPVPPPQTSPAASATPAGTTAALAVGGWVFAKVPEDWEFQPDYGMKSAAKEKFPTHVVASEQPLPPKMSLQEFARAQLDGLREYWTDPQVQPGTPPPVRGAEEAVALEVRYKAKDGPQIFSRRIHVRRGPVVGTLVFTTLQEDSSQDKPVFEKMTSGLVFQPKG